MEQEIVETRKRRSVSLETAEQKMRKLINETIRTVHNMSEFVYVPKILPEGERWSEQPKINTSQLSHKQKHFLLLKAHHDAVYNTRSIMIPFKSGEMSPYHNQMFKAKRTKVIRAEYARITKRTNEKKQKVFLEFIGLCYIMNKIEAKYYGDRFRKNRQLLRKGFYNPETDRFDVPDYMKGV